MAKKEKLLKKSRFLKNLGSLKEAVNSGKLSSQKFPYSSRKDYEGKLLKIIMEKKEGKFLKEDLLI